MRRPVLLLALAGLAAAGSAWAQGATYDIDPTHTTVIFEARPAGLSTLRGRFDRKQGTVTLDRAARSGRAEISVDTTVVSTGIASIDAVLKDQDFLASRDFPTATFVGERFVFDGDGKVTSVEGPFTLHGRTRPVVFKAIRFGCYTNPLLRREVCGGDFDAEVKRADFDIGGGLPMLGDSFRVLIQVEAIKRAD